MLQDDPELLLEVLEQSPDAFAHYGAEHELQYCNRAFVEWFFPGWKREDLVGRPIQEIVEICYACGRIAVCNGHADWREERLRSHRQPGRPYEYRLVDGRTIQGRERVLPSGGTLSVLADITEHARLVEARADSEHRHRQLFENAAVGIYRTTREGRFLEVNPALAAIQGCADPAEFLALFHAGRHFYADPDTRGELLALLDREDVVRDFETRLLKKDGTPIWISETAHTVRDRNGGILGYEGFITDITEGKRAKAARTQAEAQLRHAAQMAMTAHWVWDEETGLCIDCSETMQHFTGVPRGTYIGLAQAEVEPFVHPDDWPEYARIVEAFDKGGERFEAVYRTLPEDGAVRWCREIGERIPGPDGRMTRSIGTLQDISEDRRLQNELREAKEQLQSQLDSSPLAIITMDIDGRVRSWNPAAESIFGWTAEEVIGKPSPLIPAEREHERAEIRMMVARGERIQDYLTVRRRKNGEPVDVVFCAAPLTSDSGEIRGAVCLVSDITERKRLEGELHKQEALALHAQKLEAVATLASGIAHDFNNMLLPIVIAAENLTELLPADSAGRRDAEQILGAAERAAELVRRLLDFSRAEEAKRRRVGMKEAVRQALPLVQATLPGSIAFQVELAEDCGEVELDSGQLLQVLLNLVGNAADALRQRGRIRLELDVAQLDAGSVPRPGAMAPGRYARLTVHDEGCGIPPESLPLIFDPFYTTKEVGKGTGLGLAVTHGIVTAHHGGIEVESETGRGSTFRIYFPLLDERSPETQKRERESTAA